MLWIFVLFIMSKTLFLLFDHLAKILKAIILPLKQHNANQRKNQLTVKWSFSIVLMHFSTFEFEIKKNFFFQKYQQQPKWNKETKKNFLHNYVFMTVSHDVYFSCAFQNKNSYIHSNFLDVILLLYNSRKVLCKQIHKTPALWFVFI